MEAVSELVQASTLGAPRSAKGRGHDALALAPSPVRHRITHGLAALLIVLGAAASSTFVLAFLLPQPALASVLLVAAGAAGVAVSVAFARALWRSVTGGSVAIRNGAIEIMHPGFFSEPLRIETGRLRKVAIDDGGLWGASAGNCRFGVYGKRNDGSESHLPARSLWGRQDTSRRPGSPVAVLDVFPGVAPNVCLVFDEPVPAPKLHRVVGHGPMKNEHLAALMLRVSSPVEVVRRVPSAAVGQITQKDHEFLQREIGLIPPGPEGEDGHREHRRAALLARRYRREVVVAVIAAVVLGIPLIARVAELAS